MDLAPQPGAAVDVNGEQLWAYMASHHEEDYVLVDVRQPEEYQAGHIPGAKLIPLSEIGNRFQELELVLEIELRAFDLYKNLADQANSPEARQALLDLAQQEKRHDEGIFKKLGPIAARAR